MQHEINVLSGDDTLRYAASTFAVHSDQLALVLDTQGYPVRVVTSAHIIQAIALGQRMHEPVHTLPGPRCGVVSPEDMVSAIMDSRYDYWAVCEANNIIGFLQRSQICQDSESSEKDFFHHMETALECISRPALLVNKQNHIVACNTSLCQTIRRMKTDIVGHGIASVLGLFQYQGQKNRPGDILAELGQRCTIDGTAYVADWIPLLLEDDPRGAFVLLQNAEYSSTFCELEQARDTSRELNAIIDSSFDGIYVTDADSRTIMINDAYERITGIKGHEVVGKTMIELVEQGVFSESVSLRVLKEKRPITIVQNITRANKTIVVTGNPIFNEKGDLFRVVTNVRDVTELHQLQNKIKKMEQLQSRYEVELRQFRETGDDHTKYVIKSKKMKAVYELGLKLANVDSTILIQGESGVGKEVFAEIVHNNGRRRKKPFIKISCAAIPDNLLESELFGYDPGAFTGANREGKVGIFELAHGGTIFLDEIGEMPLGLQVKLLRVLQQKEIVRIGGNKPIQVDARIMAATNRELEEMVRSHRFRKDLFFRLNVVPVVIPPLRERKEALSHFIYLFLQKCNSRYGFSKQIAPEVVDILASYDWPGNVRELENMIERFVIMANGEVITADTLPLHLKSFSSKPPAACFEKKTLKMAMDEYERKLLHAAITKYGTSRKVAAALGINQSTVVRKAERYSLSIGK
ncbi:sigma-54 interaction domain-containing protein [Desulfogranum japonicum]|uniref:sigma-54 interaction domain-containing protein n=1 Tax=Desulfogranum japonicum TaxID=231447 RepID=UPI0004070101|nr:sigma 54-interacting transcriptional regulator [Desulfogranum japonicum]